jgi:hypothetical protein
MRVIDEETIVIENTRSISDGPQIEENIQYLRQHQNLF